MKKLFFLFVTLSCFGKVMSQTDRYIYQTEVNPDTINLVNTKVETTYLDIKGSQSLFISESKLLQDSLRTVLRQQENTEVKKSKKDKSAFPKMPNGKSIQPTFFDYFIIKNLEDRSVQMVENIGSKQVYYQEDRKMDWDISPQTAEFNHYTVQKATMTFGGRNWTAWFAPEIKIPDGPYKFLGLPGLILKLEDDKGDYRFSFVKKITIPNSFSESIKPDARKSTRINFRGDKASVRMEMVKNKDPEINFDSFNRMNQRNGTMNGGFGAQPGMNGGMPNDIIGGQPNLQPGNPLEQSGGKNANLLNIANSNPIELSNK